MSSDSQLPRIPERSMADSCDRFFEYCEPRDYVYLLDVEFDIDSQFEAIHGVLRRNREAEQSLAVEIEKAEKHAKRVKGIRNAYAVENHIALLHASVYQDAAHSMACVGMLAPFVESVFTQCFRGIQTKCSSKEWEGIDHNRWTLSASKQWDWCWYLDEKGKEQKGIARGICQLADAIGLLSRLPSDIETTLSALFGYRNKMFHCGFEWPVKERRAFHQRIVNENWPPTWFVTATVGGEPWVFYMSDGLIEHCLTTIDQVLAAFGEFARDKLHGSLDATGGLPPV